MSIGLEYIDEKTFFKNKEFLGQPVIVPKSNIGKILKRYSKQPKSKHKQPKNDNPLKKLQTAVKERTNFYKKHLEFTSLLLTGVLLIGASLIAIKNKGFKRAKTTDYDGIITAPKSNLSTGKTSQQQINEMLKYETFRSKAYLDSGGVWTIGYGHTGNVKPGDTITEPEAKRLFANDLKSKERAVNGLVKVPITQNMFDALVDIAFNAGQGNLAKSGIIQRLNAGDYKGAQYLINHVEWLKKDQLGKIQPGLVRRRNENAAKFGIDINSDNTILKPTAKPSKPNRQVKFGTKTNQIGKYNVASNVRMSAQVEDYLKQTKGTGNITSVVRDYVQGQTWEKSHASGNKFDVGMYGLSTEQIISTVVPFLRHPATKHVAFEGLRYSTYATVKYSTQIEKLIFQRYPDIKNRVQKGLVTIYHWGNKYSSQPHIDILIDAAIVEKLKQEELSKRNKIDSTVEKPLQNKVSEFVSSFLPKKEVKKENKLSKINNTSFGLIGELDPINIYQNTYMV